MAGVPAATSHLRAIGVTASTTSCGSSVCSEDARQVFEAHGAARYEDALSCLSGANPTELYCRLLVADPVQRLKETRAVVAALQQHAQAALQVGDDSIASFVYQHGVHIVEYARGCPLEDVAREFGGLLDWLRRNCLFELEKWVRQMDMDSTSEADTQPATPQIGAAMRINTPDEMALGPPFEFSPQRHDAQLRRRQRQRRVRSARQRSGGGTPALGAHVDPQEGPHPPAAVATGTEEECASSSSCSRSTFNARGVASAPQSRTDDETAAVHSGAQSPHPGAVPHPRAALQQLYPASATPRGARHQGRGRQSPRCRRRRRSQVDSEGGTDLVADEEDDARPPRVSDFIEDSSICPLLGGGADTQRLFDYVFLDQGQVPNWVRVLGLQPVQTLALYRTWTTLLGSGPLPASHRCYMVAMAGALHRCDYWIRRGLEGFLSAGGDPAWISEGVTCCPKLFSFAHYAARLAHRPWELTAADVSHLVRSCGWTLPEVVHATCICATACSLCSFAHGLGLAAERTSAPLIGGNQKLRAAMSYFNDPQAASRPVRQSFLQPLCEEAQGQAPNSAAFESRETSRDEAAAPGDGRALDSAPNQSAVPPAAGEELGSYTRLCPNERGVSFGEPLQQRKLRVTEFSWRDDAVPLIDSLLPEPSDADGPLGSLAAAGLLEEEFAALTEATENRFSDLLGPAAVHLPRMVFLYVYHLYDITADDMDYSGINQLMERAQVKRLKGYIKLLACLPERVQLADWGFDEGWPARASAVDKVQIAMIAAGARKQAALVHAMRAVSTFLASP